MTQEGIIANIETCIKFTQQAFKDSQQSLSLRTLEMSQMKKAVF